jgi:hypothetical protein
MLKSTARIQEQVDKLIAKSGGIKGKLSSQHDIPKRTFKDNNKYKKMVRDVQEELAKRNIHLKITTKQIAERIKADGGITALGTVNRFLNYGRGGKYMYYVHGPYMTTTCAIADAMGLQFVLRAKSN